MVTAACLCMLRSQAGIIKLSVLIFLASLLPSPNGSLSLSVA
jgi:hypothetical protein